MFTKAGKARISLFLKGSSRDIFSKPFSVRKSTLVPPLVFT